MVRSFGVDGVFLSQDSLSCIHVSKLRYVMVQSLAVFLFMVQVLLPGSGGKLAPKRGPGGLELAFRTPESARQFC